MNGLITEYMEALPEPGTRLTVAGYPIEIVDTDGKRVKIAAAASGVPVEIRATAFGSTTIPSTAVAVGIVGVAIIPGESGRYSLCSARLDCQTQRPVPYSRPNPQEVAQQSS